MLGVTFQVTFDCLDPERLSEFWAEVLNYEFQEPPSGYRTWQDFLRARGVPQEEWNSASAIVDPDRPGSRIYFQRVSTPKASKNRVHLDVNVGGGSKVPIAERKKKIYNEVERLTKLGATKIDTFEEADEFWVVMADPEGNEFCLQ